MSPASAASNRVADRNIGMAVQAGQHSKSRGPGSGAIEPFLTDVAYTPVTEASLAAEAEHTAATQHAAALVVTGFVIDATGGGHHARAEAIRLMRMLGIIPDPESKGSTSPHGYTVKRGEAGAED